MERRRRPRLNFHSLVYGLSSSPQFAWFYYSRLLPQFEACESRLRLTSAPWDASRAHRFPSFCRQPPSRLILTIMPTETPTSSSSVASSEPSVTHNPIHCPIAMLRHRLHPSRSSRPCSPPRSRPSTFSPPRTPSAGLALASRPRTPMLAGRVVQTIDLIVQPPERSDLRSKNAEEKQRRRSLGDRDKVEMGKEGQVLERREEGGRPAMARRATPMPIGVTKGSDAVLKVGGWVERGSGGGSEWAERL